MNIAPNLLAIVSAAIVGLDFSEENGRIAELEADSARIESAMETARARQQEVSELLQPYHAPHGGGQAYEGFAGRDVADALIAGLDPSEAAVAGKTREELERERDGLRSGLQDLAARAADNRRKIETIQREASRRVAAEVEPLVKAIAEEGRQAARSVVECFAGLQAIGLAAKIGGPDFQAMGTALEGVMGQYRLLPARDSVDVPTEIVRLLAGLSAKGSALKPALVYAASTRR